MTGRMQGLRYRRGRLPAAPKAEEDQRDAVLRSCEAQETALALEQAKGFSDEAKRLDTEVLTPGYDELNQASKQLRHQAQTTPLSEVDQPAMRRDMEAVIREGQRLDRLTETARELSEKGEEIAADPIGYMDAFRDRFNLKDGALPW